MCVYASFSDPETQAGVRPMEGTDVNGETWMCIIVAHILLVGAYTQGLPSCLESWKRLLVLPMWQQNSSFSTNGLTQRLS